MRNNSATRPDARESNAGDDFHLLWAARKAVRMLAPRAELVALRVEGPEPAEANVVDPDGDLLLGIDVTEYFGGKEFKNASRIIHSQLKYSTRHPQSRWTSAGLLRGKRDKHTGSVIHRLAQVFRAHLNEFGREVVLAKLKLAFVSNRPLDERLNAALAESKRALERAADLVPLSSLKGIISPEHFSQIEELQKAAMTLSPGAFCDFLRVLDFTACEEGSRLAQELDLIKELGQLGFVEVQTQYDSLKQAIHRHMMPEGRSQSAMTADEIAAILGIAHRQHLFPCDARFEVLESTVERTQLQDIAKTIVDAQLGPVCLHAAAGVGKTTAARTLYRYLPAGSIVVVFDCYGGGSFLDPANVRHGHARAITQIANEIAISTGGPLLLHRPAVPEDMLRSLMVRMEAAATLVRALAADALIVVIIDAADNSIAAATSRSEKSFVSDLVHCDLPQGCRVVVTSRSHRRSDIGLPSRTVFEELKPFALDETRQNLVKLFPSASVEEVQEFHNLSNKIPRVQSYALKRSEGLFERVLASLRPDGKTVENLLDLQLREAGLKVGSEGFVRLICQAMLILPRPVPVNYIAMLVGTSIDAVLDFCIDLHTGLMLNEHTVSFHDEDFEEYLRQHYAAEPSMIQSLAALLAQRSANDDYAAGHLADVYSLNGQYAELIALIHRERQPSIVSDPVVRQEVFARRARLALEAALRLDDRIEFFRLLFVVAEASKVEDAVKDLLLTNIDLACRFGNPTTVQQLYLTTKDSHVEWHGPNHMLCAAHFSRNEGTRKDGADHLDAAIGWIRHWSSLSEDERRAWSLAEGDIAHCAEAICRLRGLGSALKWLRGWRPREVVYEATRRLIHDLIKTDGSKVFAMPGLVHARADVLALIIEAAIDVGLVAPADIVERAARKWERFAKRTGARKVRLHRAGIALCEAFAIRSDNVGRLRTLIVLFVPDPPAGRFSLHSEESASWWDALLRGRSLLAVVDDAKTRPDDPSLIPAHALHHDEKDTAKMKHDREEEKKEVAHFLGSLLPMYGLRTRILLQKAGVLQINHEFEAFRWSEDDDRWTHRQYDTSGRLKRLKASTLSDCAMHAGSEASHLYEIVCRRMCGPYDQNLLLDLIEKATHQAGLHGLATRLLESVRHHLEKEPISSSEQIDRLIRCSRSAGTIDRMLGSYYFAQAVAAAAEVDEEGLSLLHCLATLISNSRGKQTLVEDAELATTFAIVIEACFLRLRGVAEDFPWQSCIEGLSTLSAGVAAISIGRWEHRGFFSYADHITSLLRGCLLNSTISPEAAVSLSIIAPLDRESSSQVALLALNSLHTRNQVAVADAIEILRDRFCRVLPLSNRSKAARELSGQIDGYRTATDAKRQLRCFINFMDEVEGIEERATNTANYRQPRAIQEEAKRPEEFEKETPSLSDRRFTTPGAIETLLRQTPSADGTKYKASDQEQHRADLLLEQVLGETTPGDYHDQLQALIRVDSNLLSFRSLLVALKQRQTHWGHHPLLKSWFDDLPTLLSRSRFGEFFPASHFSVYLVREVERELGIPGSRLIAALTRELPSHLRDLGPRAFHHFIGLLSETMSRTETLSVIKWELGELHKRLARNGLAVIDVGSLPCLKAGVELESAILWYLFGHPDRRIRWRAAHAARHMVRLGKSDILGALAQHLCNRHISPFSPPDMAFYSLAATQWFFLLIDKLSKEMPEAIVPLADVIVETVESESQGHALIAHFCRRAALRLISQQPKLFAAAKIARIQRANKPRVRKHGATKESSDREDSYHHQSSTRFHFDSLDTLPYWYAPVGRLFGLDGRAFCLAAERWICDIWGFAGDLDGRDPTSNWTMISSEWDLTSNRHGSQPTIENLKTYLELNAMFAVAAELLKQRPISPRPWERDEDQWGEWVSRWDLTNEDEWIADRRQETPHELQFWISQGSAFRTSDKVSISDIDFARALGSESKYRSEYLLAYANNHRHQYDAHEHVSVETALVSLETAQALLFALAQCKDRYDYRIPDEGEDFEFSDTVESDRFFLQGWIRRICSEREGIDQDDPLRNEFVSATVMPGRGFLKRFALRHNPSRTQFLARKSRGMPFSVFEHWNDVLPRSRYHPFQTDGMRLWIRRSAAMTYIAERNCALISRCTIEMRKDRDTSDSRDQDATKTKLSLFSADGTVQTVDGNG